MREVKLQIAENVPLRPDVFRLRLAGDCEAVTAPGQFVSLSVPGLFLRRPFSVCDREDGALTLVYQVKGKGTEALSRMQAGTLDVLTGLGNGFDLTRAGDSPVLCAGGLGFTPLYYLARALPKKPRVVLGFATAAEVLFEDEFRALGCDVTLCTADGSAGEKGLVPDFLGDASYFYACGPEGMLRALERGSSCEGEFSLEARMGCGFGACMGCTRETLGGPKRVCRDGPVFRKGEILW